MRKLFSLIFIVLFLSMLFSGKLDGKVIVIDPGHGGPDDRGAVTESGLEEAVINLKVALYLREMLEDEGAIVVMTRTKDVPVPLKRRLEIAHRVDADLFLCIHHNYMETNRSADFSIVYFPSYSVDYSVNFAKILAEKFEKYVGTKPGDIGPGDVFLMRNLKVPGVLGEPCLMSNPEREEWLRNDENLKKEAMAYRDAVIELFSKKIPNLKMEKNVVGSSFRVESDVKLAGGGAFLNWRKIDVTVDGSGMIVKVPDDVKPGNYDLVVYGISEDGIRSKALRKRITYSPKPDKVELEIFPKNAPALAGSYYLIRYSALYKGHPLEIRPSVEGFAIQKDGEIIVPYMGREIEKIELSFKGLNKILDLKFSGDELVRVVFLKGESGEDLGSVEYRGGDLDIEIPGYEKVTYSASLTEPVSFDTLVLKVSEEALFSGKKIGVICKDVKDAESVKKLIESRGGEVVIGVVKNLRDEMRVIRKFRKEGIEVVVAMVGDEKLKRFERFFKVVKYVENEKELLRMLKEALK